METPVSSTVSRDSDGLPPDAFEVLQRDFARVSQKLAQSERNLEEANADLESLCHSMAHELRSPLRQICAFTGALHDDHGSALSTDAQSCLKKVADGALLMADLVDDLLRLGRIGRTPIDRRLVSVDTSLADAMRQLSPLYQSRSIEWEIQHLSNVVCDSECVTQIFVCLLSNALKYTQSREPAIIGVGELILEGERVLFVRDNGVGFDMQFAPTLFGMFNRLNPASETSGTGAGLAVAERLVRRLGGRIWSQAQTDQGATFLFTLAPSPKGQSNSWTDTRHGWRRPEDSSTY